ncbi:ABC transporter permease [Nocardioides lianchengensis]|uniref:Transport permease protein n=1 Tax=Nocardioides lianchengensis TaxID=1045774 RepID=A0A1G6JVL4_9ACTN|nr:ABC transporter permease [Nocardioides lianchengensis]NYG08797.1 ABC-2 type transport system permease protein [Nocardioides lianchengensis]SDC22809.1 ABC-2 type transport system permease protein [Nocardioides lianchengensis]
MTTSSVAERHDLEHVPLTSPASTSGLLEVFRKRYLLRLMVRREIQARYARSFFGLAWSYINPTVRFFTFYFVFGIVLGRGGNLENFAIHLFAGMVMVHYFTETVTSGTRSLLSNKGVVQKMAMPRELFPFASMLVSLYHTLPQVLILSTACLVAGWHPDLVGFAAAGLGFLIMMLFGTSLGLMFSVFNVIMRDFGRITQTFINMIPFMVPMMYPYSLIESKFGGGWVHTIVMANPVAEAVLLMQRCFWWTTTEESYAESFPDDLWQRGAIMAAVGIVLLFVAQRVFSRLEGRVPELIT